MPVLQIGAPAANLGMGQRLMNEPTALLPFIPGGADFGKSRELFLELGCVEQWDAGDYIGTAWGEARFILQNFNDEHFAQNLMMKLEVPDLDAWWADVEARQPEACGGF
jgi:hypothetical protein